MKRSQLVSLSVPWKEERKICHSHFLKGSYGVVNSDSVTDLWFCQLRQVLSVFFSPHLDVSFCGVYWNYTCFPSIGWLSYVTFVFMDTLHIQLVVSSVKGENIPHFYYFNLVFFVIQDNNDSFFFGGSENVTKFLKWKRTATTSKGFTLTFRNKSRMRNETDQPYFVSFIRSFICYIRSIWRIEIKCYRGYNTVAVEYVSLRLVFSVWYGHFLLVGGVNPRWSLKRV